jgi:hypothetical protein
VYLRTSSRQNKDGTTVRYLSIAHNERSPGGPSVAKVLLPLGREDRLDVAGLRRLVGSINRYLGDDAGSDAGVQVGAEPGGGLRITESRPAGGAWLLDGLWQQLGIGTALREVLGGRRFTTDVERVTFALVANRALDPASKLAAAEWITHDVAIPGLAEASDDQAYRAMDLLVEADTDARVQEAVFFAVANLLNLEVDLLFFDTTSTYFECDTEDPTPPADAKDAAGAGGDDGQPAGFRRYGHSKDSRPDLPQIIIGLAVTREGIPVRVWCWPGNASDQAVLPQVKDDLRAWRLGRVVTVVDRGFSSAANLDYLRRAGGHFIAGERMRAGTPHVEEVLARQGRYREVRDNLRVKEVRLDSAPDLRWVLCHNPTRRFAPPRSARPPWTGSAASWSASTRPAPGWPPPSPPPRRPRAAATPSWPPTPAPSAPCATTRPWAAGCARPPPGGWCSTPPRSAPKPASTASTCWSPPTPTCRPRTSRWATRTCSKPSGASATSSPPSSCGRSATASNPASAPTCCCAGWRSC